MISHGGNNVEIISIWSVAGVATLGHGDGEFFTLGPGEKLSDMMSMSGVTCTVVFSVGGV